MPSHCETGGWILGHMIDGTQAEYVRIPHADTSLHHIRESADKEALVMLSDILPTGYECGVLNGRVKPGDTVAIIGAGPIGLATLLTARLYSPAEIIVVDPDPVRLAVASSFGATATFHEHAVAGIMTMTRGVGVDVAIEAVGIPETFDTCQAIIAPGGHIANIGVHGKSATLHLETLWSKNVSITTRLVDTVSTPMLLRTVEAGTLTPSRLITHRFSLDDVAQAYDTFQHAARAHALKIILTNQERLSA
jgi:alcohol dehydrogenase